MTKKKFVEIISVLIGFFGSLLLAKGLLTISPELIAKSQGLYIDYNPYELNSLAQQRADTVTGFILISIAFIIQLLKLGFLRDETITIKLGYFKSGLLALGISLFVFIPSLLFLNPKIKSLTLYESIKARAFITVQKQYQSRKNGILDANQIKVDLRYAEKLDFKKRNGESTDAYLRRYFKFLGVDFADNLDLSNLSKIRK